MNKFYQINKDLQWVIAIGMMIIFFLIVLPPFVFFKVGIWKYLLILIIVPLYSFLSTPIHRLLGILKYKSPMLCVLVNAEKNYDLHSGTSFDYLFVMGNVKGGIPFQNKVLEYHLEGLLEIIREIENNIIPNTTLLKGSSYFFSERTAKKIGFRIIETDMNAKFMIGLDFLGVTWMLSKSKGRLTFPKLKNMKTAVITADELVANKKTIERLHSILKSRNSKKEQAIS